MDVGCDGSSNMIAQKNAADQDGIAEKKEVKKKKHMKRHQKEEWTGNEEAEGADGR